MDLAIFDKQPSLNARRRLSVSHFNVHKSCHRLAPVWKMKARRGAVLLAGGVETLAGRYRTQVAM
jgi:hypothetical protein